jgi:hypothetical protein
MANNRIIFDNGGKAGILTPADKFLATLTGTIDEKLIYVANKDLPTGTKYELIDASVDLSDRTFRNAWEYTADSSVEKTSADLTADQLARHNMTENK